MGRFSLDIDSIGSIKDVNIVGFDFGDGDIEVAGMNTNGEIVLSVISKGATEAESRPNVIAASADRGGKVHWIEGAKKRAGGNDVFYCNFKRSPKSPEFEAKYLTEAESGKNVRSLYTYGELMALAFAEQVNTVMELNKSRNWNMNKPTLLYVGCPAGTSDKNNEWHGTEEQYADFLFKALCEYADKNPDSALGKYKENEQLPIDLMIVPESNAAIAFELSKTYGSIPKAAGTIVILIDLGSSTTDFCFVSDNELVEELSYSRNLGGGSFEENMLKLILDPADGSTPPDITGNRSGEKVELRMLKEEFYKKGGKTQVYETGEYSRNINRDFMGHAVTKMPITIRGSFAAGIPTVKHDSLNAAYRSVFEEYKTKCKEYLGNAKPDLICVTGGVSGAQWVVDLVKEVFKTAPADPEKPHASVALGLAMAAKTELQKEIMIGEIMENIKARFDKNSIEQFRIVRENERNGEEVFRMSGSDCYFGLRNTLTDAFFKMDYELADKTMKAWADNGKVESLDDWHRAYEKESSADAKVAFTEQLTSWWNENEFSDDIDYILQEAFIKHFGEANGEFTYSIDNKTITDGFAGLLVPRFYLKDPLKYCNYGATSPINRTIARYPDKTKWHFLLPVISKKSCYQKFEQQRPYLKSQLIGYYENALDTGTGISQSHLIEGKTPMDYLFSGLYASLEEEVRKYAAYLTKYFHSEN